MENTTLKNIKRVIPNKTFKFWSYLLLSAISAGISVVFALAIKSLINSVEYQKGSDKILYSSIFLIATVLVNFIIGVIVRLVGDSILVNYEKTLKTKVLSSYVNSNFKTVSSLSAGDLVSRIDGDVTKVASVRANLLPNIVATAVRLIGTITSMLVLQPTLTLIILAVALVIVASSFIIRRIIIMFHKITRSKISEQSSYVGEINANALAVKAFNAENSVCRVAVDKFEGVKKSRLKERYFTSFINSVINLCFTAVYTGVAIFGVYGLSKGAVGVDFGVITAMLQLVLQIRAPISGISGFFTAQAEMLVSAERLFEITNEQVVKTSVDSFEKVKLERVNFSYGNELVIKDFSLEFKNGDVVLIKGSSGIGKTTLVKILAGLYTVSSGSAIVYGNGYDISLDKVSGLCSFVPQGNMIFSGTLKENVVFGSEYDENKLKLALKTACLYQTVDSFEFKEDTVLGGKFRLSEGQEQRLAIARAVYNDAPIIILDEPTSALDKKTEDELVKNLTSLNKTLVVISHKPSFESVATVKVEL